MKANSTTEHVMSLGGAVLDDHDLDELLEQVVRLACNTVNGAHSVSITVVDNGRYRTSNSTDPEALEADEAQYEQNGGPCLDSIRSAQQKQFTIGSDTGQWPHFTRTAEGMGVTAVLSTPLVRTPPDAIGALNIYAANGDRFGDDAQRTADSVGQLASIVVGNAEALRSATQLNEQLRHAVASREIIGEAKGILMEREGCTRDEAFDILRRASQRENRKLRELAEDLVLRVEARRQGDGSGE